MEIKQIYGQLYQGCVMSPKIRMSEICEHGWRCKECNHVIKDKPTINLTKLTCK